MTLTPDHVALVILSYREAEDTLACLRSVACLPEKPRSVIVVDNASPDDAVSRIRDGWPAGHDEGNVLLALGENGGYSAGNNAGIRIALADPDCRAVWTLNNDTELSPNALQALCDRLNDFPGAGLCGSTLVYAHDRDTIQCAGGFRFTKFWGVTPAVYGKTSLRDLLALSPDRAERELDYLCGASMMVRREVFERIGLLDESYFLYYEDAEFGLRAKKKGYLLAWAPGSVVYHKEGSSTKAHTEGGGRAFRRPKLVDYLSLRNRIHVVRTYYPLYLPWLS